MPQKRRATFAATLAAVAFTGLCGMPAVYAAAAAPDPVQLTRVQFWSLGTSTRIAVEFSADFKYKSGTLVNPNRVFFDIPNSGFLLDGKSTGLYALPIGDKLVRQIRVAKQGPNATRLVLDLEGDARHTVAELRSPWRLVIEVSPAAGTEPAVPSEAPSVSFAVDSAGESRSVASVPQPAAPKKFEPPVIISRKDLIPALAPPKPFDAPPVLTARLDPLPRVANTALPKAGKGPVVLANPAKLPTPVVDARAAKPARANIGGDRSLTRALGLKLNRVVIDAGHGGHDDGAKGPYGLKEKDLVLDLALRVGKLVEERLGAEVIFTRMDDTFVPLERRPEIANEHHADLFLSIHANSSPLKSVAGVETYYLSSNATRAAMEVAARENAAAKLSIGDLEDLVQKITLSEKIKESIEFASRMQLALVSGTGVNGRSRNRGVRKAPFIVLIGAKMPAILAEVGFISNPDDEAAMTKSQYRDKLAEALCKGIEQYGRSLSNTYQVAATAPDPEPVPTAATAAAHTTTTAAVRKRAARRRASN
ncbi:hypothetical protein F183_A06010 [Bryobacterales bacterium F-183]|nr:hypothetical protein F183_A06010 [Bryobacterales bacterium F-183]